MFKAALAKEVEWKGFKFLDGCQIAGPHDPASV
jgi:hypothetical protein